MCGLWCRSKSLPDHSLHLTGYKQNYPWQPRPSSQGSVLVCVPQGTERRCGRRGRGLLISLFPLAGTSANCCSSANSQSWGGGPGPRALVHDGSVASRGGQQPPQGHWLCCGAGPNPPAGTSQSLGCFLPFTSPSCLLRPGPNSSSGVSATSHQPRLDSAKLSDSFIWKDALVSAFLLLAQL